jgi:dTDP-4-amino-4,6-dideoxygalactose transaminase
MSLPGKPALLGGDPVRPEGPPAWPVPDERIWGAIQAVCQDGSWGKYHGGNVERLEERLAAYHDVPFVRACASGTFAVELALRAFKVGPGDEVLLAAYDYGGNFLNVHAVGAQPVLLDVAPSNWNLDPAGLEAAIGPKTRALIISHLHGGVVPMREVMNVATKCHVRVIEDAAQMPGAVIQGGRAGTWGDIGVLSFGGSKLLTAGRGGALLTRHAELHHRAGLCNHRGNTVAPLSELQGAVLLPQFEQLDQRNQERSHKVWYLIERLRGIPGLQPFVNDCQDTAPGYYKLGFQFDSARFGLRRERFVQAIRAEGIALDEGFRALQVGRSERRFRQVGDLAEAARAHQGTVVLHHPVLLGSDRDLDQVVMAVQKVYAGAALLRVDE